jgi:hypothetical protein
MGLIRTVNWLTSLPPAAPAASFQDEAGDNKPPIQGQRESIFINWRALTYTGVVGMVQVTWLVLQALDEQRFGSKWWPLVLCLPITLFFAIANLSEQSGTKWTDWVGGILFALLNGAVMSAAVLGINDSVIKRPAAPPVQQQPSLPPPPTMT